MDIIPEKTEAKVYKQPTSLWMLEAKLWTVVDFKIALAKWLWMMFVERPPEKLWEIIAGES